MERIKSLRCCVLAAFAMALSACGNDGVEEGKAFDAAFVAAEADKGNLAPLKALMDECKHEVERHMRRGEVCTQLDRVRILRKPTSIRF
jgi:hypothetical protein